MDFISKDKQQKIRLLNEVLGTSYRDEPFDFANDEDFIEAVTFTTAEYVDMEHYWGCISEVQEKFDESLEVLRPALYANIPLTGRTQNGRIDEAINLLQETDDVFFDLKQEAEEKCQKIWMLLLSENREKVYSYFFGEENKKRYFSKKQIETVLEELIEITADITYKGPIKDSALQFAQELLAKLDYLEE